MSKPTTFPELNALLGQFVDGARGALGGDFVGAYLQGSFALGEADEHSDVDFIVATRVAVEGEQLSALQSLHAALYAEKTPWAQHLEGSYVPVGILRRVDPARTPLPFLDNGARELVLDPHCNTAVVRWTLRECGIVLAGPPSATLVDEVTPEQLTDEMRWMAREYAVWAREPGEVGPMNRWKQPYLVLTMCRIRHTAATGTVGSKQEVAAWALDNLDAEWAGLIEQALADRPDPVRRYYETADAALTGRTLAFVDSLVDPEGAPRA